MQLKFKSVTAIAVGVVFAVGVVAGIYTMSAKQDSTSENTADRLPPGAVLPPGHPPVSRGMEYLGHPNPIWGRYRLCILRSVEEVRLKVSSQEKPRWIRMPNSPISVSATVTSNQFLLMEKSRGLEPRVADPLRYRHRRVPPVR